MLKAGEDRSGKVTRWGILSCGKISADFTLALRRENRVVTAVAARKLDDAVEFAQKLNLSQQCKKYGSYEELCADKDVDIVYIGTIHPYHYDATSLALNNGKHVLCEKPLTLCAAKSKELYELAESKGLLLAENMWSRYFPAYKKLRGEIDSKHFGKVLSVHVSFAFPLWETKRVKSKNLGGGAFYDIGVYAVQFCNFVYGVDEPDKIVVGHSITEDNVDKASTVVLHYGDEGVAVIQIDVRPGSYSCSTANILTEKGVISVPQFWTASELHLPNGEIFKATFDVDETGYNFPNSCGMKYISTAIEKHLSSVDNKEPLAWGRQQSELQAKTIDEIHRQIRGN